jgi:hypothetical protein
VLHRALWESPRPFQIGRWKSRGCRCAKTLANTRTARPSSAASREPIEVLEFGTRVGGSSFIGSMDLASSVSLSVPAQGCGQLWSKGLACLDLPVTRIRGVELAD